MARKEELIAGLKNALDRGQGLDSAIQSLIIAGYSEVEVNDAANELQRAQMQGAMQTVTQSSVAVESESLQKKLQEIKKEDKKGGKKGKKSDTIYIILAIIVLLILACVAAYFYFKYKNPFVLDNITSWLKNLPNMFKKG